MIYSIFDRRYLEGKAEGKIEGKAEGVAEGEAIGAAKTIELGQNMVLGVLRKRFTKISSRLEKTIRRMTDAVALESLVTEAAICPSLADFAEKLP